MQSRQARKGPFTCIILCSFRHRFDTLDGAEMANVEQTKDGSTHHV